MPDFLHAFSPAIPLPDGRYGRDGTPGVTARRITDVVAATLTPRRGMAGPLTAAADALGLILPDAPRAAPGTWGTSAIGIGPGRWLVVAEGPPAAGRLAGLASLVQAGGVLVEQSDGLLFFEIGGTDVRAALAKGVALDLAPGVFPEGAAASTAVALVALTLWRTGDAADGSPTFRFAVPRSFAPAVLRWLAASAAEFGFVLSGGP